MEENRFDDMAKALGPLTTRRLTLGALLGGALSALGLGEADAARSGNCKRNPGECETCQKGKCQNKNGTKKCRAGTIKPKANGTACSVGTCQDGGCACPTGRSSVRRGVPGSVSIRSAAGPILLRLLQAKRDRSLYDW